MTPAASAAAVISSVLVLIFSVVFYGFYSVCAVNVAETLEGVNAFFENFLNVLNHSKSIAVQVFSRHLAIKVKESPTRKVKVFQNLDRMPRACPLFVKY